MSDQVAIEWDSTDWCEALTVVANSVRQALRAGAMSEPGQTRHGTISCVAEQTPRTHHSGWGARN